MKKTFGRKTKKEPVYGRDYIVTELIKSGPAASLQTQKLADGGLVVFKKIPKLKKVYQKDTDSKFPYIFIYRAKQCSYIFPFLQEENELNKLLESTELASTEGTGDMTLITMHRTARKQQKTAMNYELSELLKRSRVGMKIELQNREKKKKKPKQRSKDPAENALFIKTEVLEQIRNYVSFISEYKPNMDHQMTKALIEMISFNLFIPSPRKPFVPPLRVKAGSGRFLCDPMDVPRACWTHRSIVYNVLMHFVLCYNEGQVPPKAEKDVSKDSFQDIFRAHVNVSFVAHLVNALKSQDHLERETIVACLVLISEQCPYLKPEIWRIIQLAFQQFYEDGSWDIGVAATQISSLIQFIEAMHDSKIYRQANCCLYSDKKFVETSLFPLYKAPFDVIIRYHPVLFKYITKLLREDHTLIKPLILRLLKSWPIQSASKQLLYLEQVSAMFLEAVQRAGAAANKPHEDIPAQQQWSYSLEDTEMFMSIHRPLFKRICSCLQGENYEVSVAAIRILDHPAVFFPFVLSPSPTVSPALPAEPKPKLQPTDEPKPKAVRSHPVLSIIYGCFRHVVATHDYLEVRKTIHTLMGLLEEHWGDVCEKEIIEEDARDKARTARQTYFDTLEEKYNAEGAKGLHSRHRSSAALPSHDPRSIDQESNDDLESFEHLRQRTATVSFLATHPVKRRAISMIQTPKVKRKSIILDAEKMRRKSVLLPMLALKDLDDSADSADDELPVPLSPASGTVRRRKGSFELLLEEAKQRLAAEAPADPDVKSEVKEDKRRETSTSTSTKEPGEGDAEADEYDELDEEKFFEDNAEKLAARARKLSKISDDDISVKLRTLSFQ